ncbi:hypothetical protein [Ruegeria sp. MALMAid1280]|uniref:hypothetical protein n=1 Tax=Ruegeria sp. MALMAid1280 TaxID=3411634 RepID=UPI003B9F009A
MKFARAITALLLVALLVLMTGLGDRAHAMFENCNGGHCAYHLHMSAGDHHAGHASVAPGEGAPHQPDGAAHEGCNPFLCNVIALATPASETKLNQSAAVLAWQVTSLSTLDEPDNPDRPPNP